MRHIMIALMVALLSLGTTIEAANAARFGGGGSSGKMSRSIGGGSSYSNSNYGNRGAAAQQNAARPNAANNAANASRGGLSRFMGPLAGFLAGGLLASMLFGGHFSMPGILDILIIAAIAYFGYRFLKRRREAAASTSSSTHGTASPFGSTPNDNYSRQHDSVNQNAAAPQGYQNDASQNDVPSAVTDTTVPADFQREPFLNEMRQRFERLQKAWDANDMASIQDNVTPEFYNVLNAERRKQPENNVTEIVRLFVEMGHVQSIGQQDEATVLFHGVIREQGQEQEFNETWHLIREQRPNEKWYLQGIEQNG